MSDAQATDHLARPAAGGGRGGPLTPDRAEQILGDFRGWLLDQTDRPAATPPADPLNLQTLVAQFTALRHDVNMQTKAARTAVEQTTAALKFLQPADEEPAEEDTPDTEHLRPVVKMLLDVHDALSVARRQVEKAALLAGSVKPDVGPEPPAPVRSSFFARLFGAGDIMVDSGCWESYQRHLEKMTQHCFKVNQQLAGVADGYTMSLRRIERTFNELNLSAIPCLDEPFDPELMEVLDTAADTGRPAGTVVEVLRQGYLWNETLFRYAQVRVAK